MSEDTSMVASFDDLLSLLASDQVPHAVHPDRQMVELRTQADGLQGTLVIRWQAQGGVVLFVQSLPFEIGEGRQGDLATAMLDVNHALIIGGFGFTTAERRPYLRITLPLRGGAVPANEIRSAVRAAVRVAAKYLPSLAAVARGEN